jgi:hypothetical protein
MLPVLADVPVFAAVVNCTRASPLPFAGDVSEIHESLLAALQGQPGPISRSTLWD